MEEHKKLSDIKDVFETAELLLVCRAEYHKKRNGVKSFQAVEKPVACHCEEQDPSPVIARDKVPKQSHRFGAGSAISNPLILLKTRLPRFARNDRKKTFSTGCFILTVI